MFWFLFHHETPLVTISRSQRPQVDPSWLPILCCPVQTHPLTKRPQGCFCMSHHNPYICIHRCLPQHVLALHFDQHLCPRFGNTSSSSSFHKDTSSVSQQPTTPDPSFWRPPGLATNFLVSDLLNCNAQCLVFLPHARHCKPLCTLGKHHKKQWCVYAR